MSVGVDAIIAAEVFGLVEILQCVGSSNIEKGERAMHSCLGKFLTVAMGLCIVVGLARADDFPDQKKTIDTLRQGYAGQDMPYVKLNGVAGALGALGDKDTSGFVISWMAAHKSWQSWNAPEVAGLSRWLAGDSKEAKTARGEIIAKVTADWLKDEAAIRSVDCRIWSSLARNLGKDLTVDDRAGWVGKLRQANTGKEMEYNELSGLAKALNILGDKGTGEFVESWIAQHKSWQTWKVPEVAGLSSLLKGNSQDITAAREEIIAKVDAECMQYDAVIRYVDCATWNSLASSLGKDLDDDTRAAWIGKLRQVYTARELPPKDFSNIAGALRTLGDKDAGGFVASWMAGHKSWQTWKPAEVAALSAVLVGDSKEVKSARGEIIARVTADWLKDEAAVQSVGCATWSALARYLGKDLSAADRTAWIGQLRQVYTARELPPRDFSSIAGALRTLGDKDAGGFVASWMAGHKSWQSWKPAEVAALSAVLVGDSKEVKSARGEIIAKVTADWLKDEAAVQSVGCATWSSLTIGLGKDLDADTRTAWISKLRQVYAAGEIQPGELAGITNTLKSLGDKDVGGFVASWMSGHKSWQSWKAAEVVGLTSLLADDSKETKSARGEIIAKVTADWLKDEAAVRSVNCRTWSSLVSYLGKDLSVDDRASWVGKLRQANVDKEMQYSELSSITRVLSMLGDKDIGGFAASWMAGHKSWQSWKISEVMGLSSLLKGGSNDVKAARGEIIAKVTADGLKDEAAVRSVGCATWNSLAIGLGKDLDADTRTAWVSKLRQVYAAGEIQPGELAGITNTLKSLGDKDISGFVASWMAGHKSWQSWKAPEVSRLASLVGGDSKEAKAARGELAATVAAWLKDKAVVQSVDIATWRALAGYLAKDLTADSRTAWIGQLHQIYAGRELQSKELAGVTIALKTVGDPDVGGFVANWMASHKSWQSWKPAEVAALSALLVGDSKEVKSARGEIIANLRQGYAALEMQPAELFGINKALNVLGDTDTSGLTASWMAGHKSWESWKASDVAKLSVLLAGNSSEIKAARGAIIAKVTADWLKDEAAIQSIDCGTWKILADCLGKDMPAESRTNWAGKLRQAYAIKELKPTELSSIARALSVLGDAGMSGFVASWMTGHKSWESWKAPEVAMLSALLVGDSKEIRAARGALIANWRFEAKQARP